MRSFARSALVVAVLLVSVGRIAAQGAPAPSDAEVTNRLAYIQRSLDDGGKAADLWWHGWLIGYGVATFGQVAAGTGTHDTTQKQDLLVGAATSGLGAIGQVVFPLDAGSLAVQLRAMSAGTAEARRAKLATAERFLRRSAAQEALGRSWKAHATAAVVNLAAGLVVWRHYDRPARDGLLTFALGQLVSEVQIFTQPTKAIRDLREYERRSDFERAAAGGGPQRSWYVRPSPGGFLVGCRF
jgi:hypothetical protein